MENIFHFIILFSWTFYIWHFFLLAKSWYLFLRNTPGVSKIWLIANQDKHCIFFSILFNLPHPKFAHIRKTLLICEIKYHQDSLTAPIIGACNCSEALLTSRIPNLKLNMFVVDCGGFEAKINTNGCQIMFLKLIFCKSNKNRRFTNSWIANDDRFV